MKKLNRRKRHIHTPRYTANNKGKPMAGSGLFGSSDSGALHPECTTELQLNLVRKFE